MFYTQSINVIDTKTSNILKTIKVDIQPISNQIAYMTYGYTSSIEYRIYCNCDQIIALGAVIQYKNVNYQVVKVLDWGSYMEILIDKYTGAIGGGDTW